jgi:FKBP12-rapamycin complex-associated protein
MHYNTESEEEHVSRTEMRNERALKVYNRVKDKLNGRDFDPNIQLNVEEQVARLIQQATDNVALSQHFTGWCAFW